MPRLTSGATVAANRVAVRGRVIDAWHELLAERGYGAVTLADVARRIGMSRSALYRYVPDKVTLLQLLIDREVERFLLETEQALAGVASAAGQLEVYLRCQLEYFAGQQVMGYDMSTALTAPQHASVLDHLAPVRRRLLDLLERGVANGEFRPLDVVITGDLVVAVLASHQMELARGEVDLETVASETVAFVLGAVLYRADP